jgi:2-C-methyl-D-erythritol 4-phosphate cytidylyltransferase
MTNFAVIIPAAGESRRFRNPAYKKPFAPLAGRAVWLHSAERFLNRSDVKQVIVVISESDQEEFQRKFGANIAILGLDVCIGGAQRTDSIQNAIQQIRDDIEYVAVHDAARPCLIDPWVDAVFAAAVECGAAILATPVSATLKRSAEGKPATIVTTVDREGLWEAQTPQAFRRDWLEQAYASRGDATTTDDAELVQRQGRQVRLVAASPLNLKITTKDDLRLAEQILNVLPKPKPGGFAHPFADDDLWR